MSAKSREEVRQAVLDALASVAPEIDAAKIAADKPLRTQVDIDSFDFLNVVIRLHERLGIDIPEADYGRLGTLASTVDYLAERCGVAR